MSAKYKSGTPKLIRLAPNKEKLSLLYNSVLRGYLNYYSITHNYSRVASSLEFNLKSSSAQQLAAK